MPRSPERRSNGVIEFLETIGGILLLYASVSISQKIETSGQVYGRTQNAVCTSSSPTVVFEAGYNPETERQIQSLLNQMPDPARNAIGADRFKVLVETDRASVQARYNKEEGVLAYADPNKKDIVMYDAFDLPHEAAHAVDSSFGWISESSDFQEAVEETAALDEVNVKEGRKRLMYLRRNFDERENTYLQLLTKLPNLLYRVWLRFRPDFNDYVNHVFVYGFESFYYPELLGDVSLQERSPKLYAAMERFDGKLKSFCG